MSQNDIFDISLKMRHIFILKWDSEVYCMNKTLDILEKISSSIGYFPNISIKVAIATIIIEASIIGFMVLCLLIINKNSK